MNSDRYACNYIISTYLHIKSEICPSNYIAHKQQPIANRDTFVITPSAHIAIAYKCTLYIYIQIQPSHQPHR